eukprot:TRINITY_DN773067_c0_g1_i1.p1 TRINITY_DN773067_c0_g1~~TRINITY_DN773067_c0_g1_i1.p1  ORF type:complete len:399 (-),score=104.89 TRINITY_DN773067_c0_g1_i1:177-1373(-)
MNRGILAAAGLLPLFGSVFATEQKGKTFNFKKRLFGNYENRIRCYSAPEKIFAYFCSEIDAESSSVVMTPSDFVRAITPFSGQSTDAVGCANSKYSWRNTMLELSDEETRTHQPDSEFLKFIDIDGNGFISFSEFLFFMTLLVLEPRNAKAAFKAMDVDHSGTISREEFVALINSIQEQSPMIKSAKSGSITELYDSNLFSDLFGLDGEKDLKFEEFMKFITEYHHLFNQWEFERLDCKNTGVISQRDLGSYLVSFAKPRDMPGVINCLPRLSKSISPEEGIDFEEFSRLQRFMERSSEFQISSKVTSSLSHSGQLSYDDFKHAVMAAIDDEKDMLSETVMKAVFALSDIDGDGYTHLDELIWLSHARFSRGLEQQTELPEYRRFLRRMGEIVLRLRR